MEDDKKQMVILKALLIYYLILLVAPYFQTTKYVKTETIVVFDIIIREKFNIVQLDYSFAKQVSMNGELVYLPIGRRRIIVFDGIYDFQTGNVYELTYTPMIVGHNDQPIIREVKELI